MRVFISINLPKEVQEEIGKIQDKLPEFSGKKTELENLHLTLKFLGEVNEERIEEIREGLRGIKFEIYRTELKHLGFFDNQKYGVVWIYLSNCEELQKIIDDKLKNLFEPEKRFMSHLTIARVKNIKDKKRFLEELNKLEISKIDFEVNGFYLMKSELSPEGPKYEVVEKYGLKEKI